MTDILATNLRSVALRERNIGHPELAGIIDSAANEIERLHGLLAWHDSTVPEILADNKRLRAVLHQLVSEGKISPNIARELLGRVTIEASP